MNYIWQVIKELVGHIGLIYKLSLYEIKSKYKMHYLGIFWQFLNPAFQIGIFWFVFGLGIRGGEPVGEIPFFLWFIVAMVPWLFISSSIIQGTSSIHSQIGLVSKMKFPMSTLPAIKIMVNSFAFILMLLFVLLIATFRGFFPGYYLLQLPYYLVALYTLIYGLSLLLATLSTIVRDVQLLTQSVIRVMRFLLPIFWIVDKLPQFWVTALKLSPFYYLIQGFRDTLLGQGWFFDDLIYTFYFWAVSILILLLGSYMHLKFRSKLIDYL